MPPLDFKSYCKESPEEERFHGLHFELLRKMDNAARDSSGKGLLLKEGSPRMQFQIQKKRRLQSIKTAEGKGTTT